ncbi:deoxynucleoside triphosphate triphosphohydrolase SAMHD1-like isoform X2 [Crassostrea virginica]
MAEGGLKDEFKVLNDPIHGHIEIHPLCVKIMDTPQFQRLRYLKQLGGAYFVYPGASHNRFEHSLGVCHLAGQLVTSLKDRQPELEISEPDILCVKIAGLCHDLGHGPFSHLFDKFFLPAIGEKHIKHEDLSLKMFDYLVEDNKLSPEFEKYKLTETDKTFIKELIKGRENDQNGEWTYEGRPKEKGFLYDIVANKRCEIDVDKWDYFARDCHMLGINNNFDHARCIKYARVLKVDDETGDLQIGFRDKEVGDLYDMFHTRNTLHRRAYQHIVTKIIEKMITEALREAYDKTKIATSKPNGGTEEQAEVNSKTGKPETIRTKLNIFDADGNVDIKAYQKLTDSIFEEILWSTDDKLEQARGTLIKILKRELYKCVGETCPPPDAIKKEEDKIKDEVWDILQKMKSPIEKEDIIVDFVYLDYGKKKDNPIDHAVFYNKENRDKPLNIKKKELSNMLPENFEEQKIRCYCKREEKGRIAEAKKAFVKWCKENGCPLSDESVFAGMTPVKDRTKRQKEQKENPPPSSTVKSLKY